MEIDYERYEKLLLKKMSEMTEEEKEFFKYMYHVEEFKAGLDGDY